MADVVPPSPSFKKAPASLSISTSHSTLQRKGMMNDFEFNLGSAKARVFKDLDEKTPPNFRKFFQSTLYDRMLQTCLLYFNTMFQTEWIIRTMERSRKQHLEGYNPYVVAARIHELEEETKQLRMQVSPIYSEIILKHSSYEKPQQDRLFFEALYQTLILLLDEAFARLQKRAEIEQEIGNMFRSKHFNLYKRKNQPPRSVDSLTVKELYTIKNETENRALNAKLLSSLFEKPSTLGVTVASVTNTPLITQYIMSPIVARSMMKDPEARKNMMTKTLAAAKEEEELTGGKKLGQVFRSSAMLKGVDPSKLAAELTQMTLPKEAQESIGLMTAERSRKPDKKFTKPGGSIALPEAAGLPTDDVYNYLTMLKRYIQYGPQMGLVGPSVGVLSGQDPSTTGPMRTDSREPGSSETGAMKGISALLGPAKDAAAAGMASTAGSSRMLAALSSLQQGDSGS